MRHPRRMASLCALLPLFALAPGGCAGGRPMPPETFEWRGKAVTFSPPPPAWRREGVNDGGFLGIRFVLTGSVGERIGLADHRIAERDRRAPLRELLAGLDGLDDRQLARAISLVRWRTGEPLSEAESLMALEGNARLDRATVAVFQGDRSELRREVEAAIALADAFELRLGDVLERVRFRPERHSEPARWTVTDERDTVVAGVPAYKVDYTWRSPEERLFHGREYYFVDDHHLFQVDFHGLERNLRLFDKLVASISLPDSVAPAMRLDAP